MQSTSLDAHESFKRHLIFLALNFSLISLYLLSSGFGGPQIGSLYAGLHVFLFGLMVYIWRANPFTARQTLCLGIAFYLFLVPLASFTSNDSQRYLWDGAVLLSGFDPYITAPNALEVQDLRSVWPTPEEHANYPTLYPPGALLLFGLSAKAGPTFGLWLWKVLASLALVGSYLIGYKLLKRRGVLKHLPLLVLNPLLYLETAIGLHIDVFSVLGILAALYMLERKFFARAGMIIGLAASIKFLPALIAGPLLFYLRPKAALKIFIGSALTWYLIYLGAFHLGFQPLGLLPEFFDKWSGGAPFYPAIDTIEKALGLDANGQFIFKALLAVIGFGLSAWLAYRCFIIAAMALSLSVPLVLTPVLFPWYVTVLIPLLAIRPSASLLLPLGVVSFFYVVLDKWVSQNIWELPSWPAELLAGAIVLGLMWDGLYDRIRQRPVNIQPH